MTEHKCKDCKENPPGAVRLTAIQKNGKAAPGLRCATHYRQFKSATKKRNHERRVQKTYNLPPGHYDALLEFQGGVCAICRKAKGVKRALAVDHRHSDGQVRGLCCLTCNKILLGRYGIPALQRAIEYLTESPYEQFLKGL